MANHRDAWSRRAWWLSLRKQGREWDRLLWSGLLHADDMHIYYNMASFLWKARLPTSPKVPNNQMHKDDVCVFNSMASLIWKDCLFASTLCS